MDNQANVIGARPGDAERPQESGVAALGRGGRISRRRKSGAVLRLLRGGAALIERDLLNEKIALLESDRPFARRRRKS